MRTHIHGGERFLETQKLSLEAGDLFPEVDSFRTEFVIGTEMLRNYGGTRRTTRVPRVPLTINRGYNAGLALAVWHASKVAVFFCA